MEKEYRHPTSGTAKEYREAMKHVDAHFIEELKKLKWPDIVAIFVLALICSSAFIAVFVSFQR